MSCRKCSAARDACAPTFVKCNFGKSPCGGGASSRSPCGICCPPQRDPCSTEPNPCDRFAGSFLVDALAAVIFFFFWMMQFWLNMASCLYKVILCLIRADRPIQIVVATLFIILFGSLILHGMFGDGPCPKCRDVKPKISSCAHPKTCSHHTSCSNTKVCEAHVKPQPQPQKQPQKQQQQQQQQQQKKESYSSSSSATSLKSSPTFRIKCKDASNVCVGPIDKTFYLTLTDERKKKLYEASAKFSLLSKDHKPKLMVTTEPIIIENY